ncbi:MAG: 2-amino-4-hydroxy-6-hydroxymethyldihydropteridine diphosphokinase [Clostridiales bacterium]|nr:2-amino-4-hydroxy-6-hydroxymethyldihydropteridine diphosphokinase [Clostridiales bacterium]
MDVIKIRGLEVNACHGVFDSEKINKQPFIFDADLELDFFGAAKDDDLNKTVNYAEVCNLIVEIASKNTFSLIEKLAYECAFEILDSFPVQGVKITVWKPNAPVEQKFSNLGVVVSCRRERVLLSLGSSMEDKKGYLDFAINRLNSTRGIKVRKVSSYIQTPPYGGVAQNSFLNCAAEIQTYLSPRALLEEIHAIESEGNRVRTVRWGDRTLDIDIIFFGDKIICDDNLIIPHSDYKNRDFVLQPLKEIAPDFVCPLTGKRLREL